jgi:hypothetical protein
MKKIFFSWQSDLPAVRNKLQKAVQIAVKELGDELEEAERPEFDKDTQGTFASEEIMATIFGKIDRATLFIADATPITKTDSKLIPNPNVMVEIGYALRAMPAGTKLFAVCDDGSYDVEKMPFDIRTRKHFVFSSDDTPSAVAVRLKPILAGMLTEAMSSDGGEDEVPLVYSTGASTTRYSDGITTSLNIYNADDVEYLLTSVEVDGKSTEPMRAIRAKDTVTVGIGGLGNVYDSVPTLRLTIERRHKKFFLEQDIIASKGADDRYHFERFVETSRAHTA